MKEIATEIIKPALEQYLKGEGSSLLDIAASFGLSRIQLSSVCKEIYGPDTWRRLSRDRENLIAKRKRRHIKRTP